MAPLPQTLATISHRIHDAFADVKISSINLSPFEIAQLAMKMQPQPSKVSDIPYSDSLGQSSHPEHGLVRRDSTPVSEMDNHILSKRLTTAPNPTYTPGAGTQPYYKFNNKGYFALFAILGAAMVLASIWFFFWARNGGFQWRRGDWEDYKSTVLRRKGPDGKTLSNATKSTKLGGGSVVAGMGGKTKKKGDRYTDKSSKWGDEMAEMEAGYSHKHGKSKRTKDPELAAYRAEKPARIGGLNRQADGSHFDYSNTDRSEAMTDFSEPPPLVPSKPSAKSKKEKDKAVKAEKEAAKRRAKLRLAAAKNAAKVEATMKKTEEKHRKEALKQQAKSAKKEPSSSLKRPPPPPSVTVTDDDGSTVWTGPSASGSGGTGQTGDSYYNSYRPHAAPMPSQPVSARSQRTSYDGYRSSRHQHQHQRSRYLDDLDEMTEASSETGTKVYEHHIPGLGRPAKKPGYRRGGGTRRDSLSDSEGETRTTRS
ncbi:hypothetical protein EV356DRAFT_506492 [Viridothelium virens]|uniref:Uncharacterized protein n=1 Tax=Viridothelium virens TaxID=1048519 RepID=A0A6A6H197_VIRVR|nr:hypothetical protein EV356DRAFT_506492 [Viridothelium virens]